jgi:two-component system, cell cycle sensor histidine kinase and response regulator CckA
MLNSTGQTLKRTQRVYLWVGITIAILVAAVLPVGYFALSFTYMRGALDTEAEINASAIGQVIKLNPELWRYEQARLEELLSRRPRTGSAETRRIVDPSGIVVAESVNRLPEPTITRACLLYEGNLPIGRVEISRSLFPILTGSALVALLGALIGTGIYCLMWNLSFKKLIRAEHQLREFIDKVMENGPHAVLLLAPDGTVSSANAQAVGISGLCAEQLTGRSFASLLSEEDRHSVTRQLQMAADASIAVANFDATLIRPQGEPLQVSCALSPLLLEGGVSHLLISLQDITVQVQAHEELRLYAESLARQIMERRKIEEALGQSEARFRNLLQDVGSVAVRGYAPDGTTQYWNHACERLYGYSAAEAMGTNLADMLAPTAAGGAAELVLGPRFSGQPVPPRELTLMRKDGTPICVYSTQVTVSLPGRSEELFFIDVDLTERNRNQEEKARLEAKLLQAQKMEVIGRLAGGVAHDFNNMLTVIVGYANMALVNMEPDHPLYPHLKEIYQAAERSAHLTKQLLAFARRQTIEPKVLDLNQTVTGMINMMQRLIGEGIRLNWEPEDALWPVKVDPCQIDQILANLCVNARDAISDIGTISISTTNRSLEVEYFDKLPWTSLGEYVCLSVTDNGQGIGQDILPHIFEPFYTTKGVGKGTGLGLATVYGIVKQNNGFINVDSRPGSGTRFDIFLPRHRGPALPSSVEVAAKLPQCGRETILLVEDEATILELTRQMLVSLDYRVLPAATPAAALKLARRHAAQISLVLTDVVMPGMNGRGLAQSLSARHPHLKHLFMSGYAANVIESHGLLHPGVQFLHKPFSLHDLASKVRQVLDSEMVQVPGPLLDLKEAQGETGEVYHEEAIQQTGTAA